MDLYIGNATKQRLQFEFRLPDKSRVSRDIQTGTQTGFRDLKDAEIDAIIAQHRRYGMVSVEQVKDAKGKVDYIYSIGRPIKTEVLVMLSARNDGVLIVRGRETRKRLAIAINENLNHNLASNNRVERVAGFDLTVVEKEPIGGYRTDIAQPVGEKIELDLGAQASPPDSSRRRGRSRRAIAA
ncbi:MAG TPA: hypothetical protein VMV19_17535 [Xanthobacteraceae bacterium]|nr:hypothetical protein [Xanthobacteraceae bacterium]